MATTQTINRLAIGIKSDALNRLLQKVTKLAVLPGRIMLASVFFSAGWAKVTGWETTAGYMESHGIPLVPLLLLGAIGLELGGGLALLLGWQARLAAAALFAFLIPTTLIFHAFWNLTGVEYASQMTAFGKNLAIMGGLLMVVGLGAGGYSLDGRKGISLDRTRR